MPIPVPNLDDRDFRQLLEEALERVVATSDQWTDLSPSDPGITLLEAFAHLTEVLIYRLNRIPEKAYRVYLNLIGAEQLSPAAASVRLRFTREADATGRIVIPRGTIVLPQREGEEARLEFVVTESAELAKDDDQVEIIAHNFSLVEGELLGMTSGESTQAFRVAHPPVVRSAEQNDFVLAVESREDETTERLPAREFGGRPFRIWREVGTFADASPSDSVYTVDRQTGLVRLGVPAGMVPSGREVRVWYPVGGGAGGNVAAGVLKVMADPIKGLTVTNPERATGGSDEEPIEDALIRAPQDFHTRDRAVTERDYELLATRSGAVSRARAYASADIWAFAPRGSVEVVLVPHIEISSRDRGRVTLSDLEAGAGAAPLQRVEQYLAERRPLGVHTKVRWAHLKTVSVRARVGIRRDEDAEALEARVHDRLHRTVNPLPAGRRVRASQGADWPGWPFGQSLRASDVYDILLAEPGVVWADRVRLVVDQVPDRSVGSLAADNYQEGAWYSGSGARFFRSLNDAVGWELARTFDGEEIRVIEPYPREPGRVGLGLRPGLLAVATGLDDDQGSRVYVSDDMGETWRESPVAAFVFPVEDLAWLQRDDQPALLIATSQGLYELSLVPGATPTLISVDPDQGDLGFYQVVAYTEPLGNLAVAVASQRARGVYRSRLEGRSGTFRQSGLVDEDVRTLEVQYEGTATFLWAGIAAEGGDEGDGCYRSRLEEDELTWAHYGDGWQGGSCWGIGFSDQFVFGASHSAGVQRLSFRDEVARWWRPAVDCGLPLREVGRFHPVRALAIDQAGGLLLAGGPDGVFRSQANDIPLAESYKNASRVEFDDAVTVPSTWLFVSGEHEVEVVTSDAATRD